MKYFIDTEFIEGFHKPLFGKKRHFIDLISIGIVAEDNRIYYAISNEFDLKTVWNKYDLYYGSGDQRNLPPRKVYWLRENVLKPIFEEWKKSTNDKIERLWMPIAPIQDNFNYKSFRKCIKYIGKSNKEIAEEIGRFIRCNHHTNCNTNQLVDDKTHKPVEFYGYFADYDWVLFCSLFGRMIDLPSGFPMYCRDLKQMLDERAECASHIDRKNNSIRHPDFQKTMYDTLSGYLNHIKEMPAYPKQTNEHNALADAKWNLELFKFLQTISSYG